MAARAWTGQATRRLRSRAEHINGLLDLTPKVKPDLFGDVSRTPRRLVVIDETVMRLYGSRIGVLLDRYSVGYEFHEVAGGENAKNWPNVERVMAAMDSFGVPRAGEVIGFGGGVLHDVLGVACGLYRRGVPFRFFATTLLSAIDAMFALKCGVNVNWKNRAGLYYPAVYAATDNAFFATLSETDIREGFAEMMKWAIAGDAKLFRALEKHGPGLCAQRFAGSDEITRTAIGRTISGMTRDVYRNAFELGTQASWLGHSLSQGMEPDVPHGQAVTLETLVVTMVARAKTNLSVRSRDRIIDAYRAAGLDVWDPVLERRERLTAALDDTVLHRGGLVTVPRGKIGRVTHLKLTLDDVARALDDLYACVVA